MSDQEQERGAAGEHQLLRHPISNSARSRRCLFSRSRWRMDAEVFQTVTNDCHLNILPFLKSRHWSLGEPKKVFNRRNRKNRIAAKPLPENTFPSNAIRACRRLLTTAAVHAKVKTTPRLPGFPRQRVDLRILGRGSPWIYEERLEGAYIDAVCPSQVPISLIQMNLYVMVR